MTDKDPYLIIEIKTKIKRLESEIDSISSVWYLRPDQVSKIERLDQEIERLETKIKSLTPSQTPKT